MNVESIAAAVGIVGACLTGMWWLVQRFREQPRVRVWYSYSIDIPKTCSARLHVRNLSWSPLTIVEAGYVNATGPLSLVFSDGSTAEGIGSAPVDDRLVPVEIAGRGAHHFDGWFDTVPHGFDIDVPVQPYVVLANGREITGASQVLFRLFTAAGWGAAAGFHPDYVKVRSTEIEVPPAARWWHVWRSRNERHGRLFNPETLEYKTLGPVEWARRRRRRNIVEQQDEAAT